MNLETEIRKLASTLSIGNSGYFNCPKCGRRNKFGITNNVDSLVYQCFSQSCRLKSPPGGLPNKLNKDVLASILNKKLVQQQKKFELPNHLIDGFASENSISLALRYDLLEGYSNGRFTTSYDPRLQRQVFFHRDDTGSIVGAMGRALSSKVVPKAYIYPNSDKTPFIVGEGQVAVIVEDILSAIKISNIGLVGVALSGTELALDYLTQLKRYDTIIICLDKDASIKSLKLKKLVDFFCKDVRIVFIERDFKDMTREEARKVLADALPIKTEDTPVVHQVPSVEHTSIS